MVEAVRLARLEDVQPDPELREPSPVRADERQAAVGDVIQTIARTTLDLDAVLQTVIDRAVELCRGHKGNIARREGDVFRVVAFVLAGVKSGAGDGGR